MAKRIKHETRILLLTLLSGAPAVALTVWLLWRADFSDTTRWITWSVRDHCMVDIRLRCPRTGDASAANGV